MMWMRWYHQHWLKTQRCSHSWVVLLMYGCQLSLLQLRSVLIFLHQLEMIALKSEGKLPINSLSLILIYMILDFDFHVCLLFLMKWNFFFFFLFINELFVLAGGGYCNNRPLFIIYCTFIKALSSLFENSYQNHPLKFCTRLLEMLIILVPRLTMLEDKFQGWFAYS